MVLPLFKYITRTKYYSIRLYSSFMRLATYYNIRHFRLRYKYIIYYVFGIYIYACDLPT